MIELSFTTTDATRVRFAFSPLWEAVESLRVLERPDLRAVHLPWVRAVRDRLAGHDLEMLRSLVRSQSYIPDFLTPPPQSPLPDLAEELEQVRQAPPERVVRELAWYGRIAPLVPAARPLFDDTRRALHTLSGQLENYWNLALADIWPRMHGLLEGEVLRRSRDLVTGGASLLFQDLHEIVTWDGEALRISKRWEWRECLAGRGLLLVPSVFSWPDPMVMVDPYQPTLLYPARGVATLWEIGPPPPPGALAALLGRTRAGVLTTLAAPASTTELARRLGVTPGAVNQHLAVLHGCGLVTRHRVGRQVLYARTLTGDALADGEPQSRVQEA